MGEFMKIQRLFTVAIFVTLMTAACGGGSGDRLGASSLDRSEETEIAPTEITPDDTKGDEVILPSGPTSTPEVSPIPEYPAPAGEPAVALSLQINAEKKPDTRLGLVKLNGTVTGKIEELYLWSEGFNRFPGDKTNADPCGPIADASMGVTRHLLVHSTDGPNLGYDLNDGSPAHTALLPYLDSAQHCDAAICEGFTGSENVPACRIDLNPSQPVTFYTRALTNDAVYRLCAKTAEDTTCADSDVIAAPTVSFSDVAAALSPEGKIRFTLNYAYALRAVTAPNGCIDVSTAYDDRDNGRGNLVADCPLTMPAVRLQKTAVQETSGSEISFQRINPARFFLQGPSFAAAGIGNGNTAHESFHIEAQDPVVTINGPYGFQAKEDGCPLGNSCEGTVKIKARVSREVTVTRAGSVSPLISGKTTAGIDWIHLQRNDDLILPDGKTSDGLPKTKTIEQYETTGTEAVAATAGEGEATFTNVGRNHKRYRWRARVSVDGKKFDSAPVSMPYVPKFTIAQSATTLVWDGAQHHDGGVLTVTAHHIKDVRGECTSSYGSASYSILHPGWGYGASTEGTLHPTVLLAQDDATNPLTCRFWGVSHDGQAIDGGTFTWTAPAPPPPPPGEDGEVCVPILGFVVCI